MPTVPTVARLFFCRLTMPSNQELMDNILTSNMCCGAKHYTHPFLHFFYVHETGHKTNKPHYHFAIICKTNKPVIQEWIRRHFGLVGNEQFQVSDKYLPETLDETLSYMYKGGINVIKVKPNNNYNIDESKLITLLNNRTTVNKGDDKFHHYFDIIKNRLKYKLQDISIINDRQRLFNEIYKILMNEAISSCKLFRRNIIAEHAFVYLCHFSKPDMQEEIIRESGDTQYNKIFDTR